jgi:hypothetical protein
VPVVDGWAGEKQRGDLAGSAGSAASASRGLVEENGVQGGGGILAGGAAARCRYSTPFLVSAVSLFFLYTGTASAQCRLSGRTRLDWPCHLATVVTVDRKVL